MLSKHANNRCYLLTLLKIICTLLLPTAAVASGRSEGFFSFQETEYENEDDEDGVDDVNLLPNPQLSNMERPTTNEVIGDKAGEDSEQSAEDDTQYATVSEPSAPIQIRMGLNRFESNLNPGKASY